MKLVDIDEPTPGPGEIRLRVTAAAIGMPDAFMCQSTYALTPKLPFVPGQEVCGIVDEVGADTSIEIGTRVMAVTNFFEGRGGFAESTIAREDSAFRVPDAMNDVDAAAFRIGFSTAWIGLVRRGNLQADEWLVVLGAAGGSGATAMQLGRALGARVIAVAGSPAKVAMCKAMGAELVIDRTVESVPEAVLAVTNGRGADVIYDPVGGDPAANALRAIAPGGRILAIGFASGTWVTVNTAHAVRRNYSLVGVYAGGYTRQEQESDHEALLSLYADGSLSGFAHAVDFATLPGHVDEVANGAVIGKSVAVFGNSVRSRA